MKKRTKHKRLIVETRQGLALAKEVVAVNEHTLMRRINRLLAHDDYQLLKTRRSRSNPEQRTEREIKLGTYFVVGDDGDRIIETHVDLEAFARKHGVLAAYESL